MSMMPEVRLTRLRIPPQKTGSTIILNSTSLGYNNRKNPGIITSNHSCVICGFGNHPKSKDNWILPNKTPEHIYHSSIICKLLDITDSLVIHFFMKSMFCKSCHQNIREIDEKLNILENLQSEIEEYKSQVDGLIRGSLEKDVSLSRPRRTNYQTLQTLENMLKIHVREMEKPSSPLTAENVKEDYDPVVIIKEEILEEYDQNENHFEDVLERMSSSDSTEEIELPRESDVEDFISETEANVDNFVEESHHRPDHLNDSGHESFVKVKKNSKTRIDVQKKKKVVMKSSGSTPLPTIPCGIEDCPSIFVTLRQRGIHIKKYHTEEGLENAKRNLKYNTWKCMRCIKNGLNAIFPSNRQLRLHTKTHPKVKIDDGPWTCDICGTTLENSSPTIINEHNLKHFKNNEHGPLTCKICFVKFTSQDDLTTHSLLHKVECPFQCVLCSIVTTSSLSLRQHMVANHPEEIGRSKSSFKCQIEGCGKVMLTEKFLETHMLRHKIMAGEAPGVKCTECDYIGVAESHVKDHMLRVHAKEKMFQCEQCGNQYKDTRGLARHLKVHKGRQDGFFKDKCKICGKMFTNATTLKLHEEIHSGVSHLCDLCGKCFGTTTNLAQHRKTHFKHIYPPRKRKKRTKQEKE